MREIDRLTTEQFGTPSLVLMENAAAATARVIVATLSGELADKSVLVLCGRGNNGGDGAATARLLAHTGSSVQAILFGKVSETRGDARTNFEALTSLAGDQASGTTTGTVRFVECETDDDARKIIATWLSDPPDVIIDALLAKGLTRPLA